MFLYCKVNFFVCYFDGFSLFFVVGFVLLFLEYFFFYFFVDLIGFFFLIRYGVVKLSFIKDIFIFIVICKSMFLVKW